MKRTCDICGLEAEEYWMHPYNTGRRVMWLCWDCYKQSQYEAVKSDMNRQHRLHKIHEAKKKTK